MKQQRKTNDRNTAELGKWCIIFYIKYNFMKQEDEVNNILTDYSSVRSFQLLKVISFCLVFRLLNSD